MGRPVLLRHDASLAFEQQLAARGSALEHPERADRIIAIEAELARRDWLGYARAEAPVVDEGALVAVHGHDYVERVRAAAAVAGGTQFGEDTTVNEASCVAALRAAGGACALAEALLSGDSPTGMSVARPPGHHADTTVPQASACSTASRSPHSTPSTGSARAGCSSSTGTSTTATAPTTPSVAATACCSRAFTRRACSPVRGC